MNIGQQIINLQTQINSLTSSLVTLQAGLKDLQNRNSSDRGSVQPMSHTELATHIGTLATTLREDASYIASPISTAAVSAESVLKIALSVPYGAAGIGVGVDQQEAKDEELGRWIIKIGISPEGTFYCAGIGPA
ncbi:hypothetical protein [Pseudomonas oryzihabitans]|uniref:hypothetical protein n=1 Tax=Pseudomonas oryzihabitans TaxID=47885 RepID=UPI00241F784B|nr:hypothetical protein [Pseudomonas oryzihabitans]